ncbi:MAG: tetratricopeptide repeat protein [Sphaerospermopsis sp. SIO1G2]|nr:tetratricopeptide repeat protein [Sphaerospermopsis sp. SIO1G2]
MSTQEGQENRANRLMGLASQLSQTLNVHLNENNSATQTPINEADRETYLQFLVQVLEAVGNNSPNLQAIYPLLAANTDKLNLAFAQLLHTWATTKFKEAETETVKSLAVKISDFSSLLQQFPLGNKANNMEIAITGYEIVSTVFTRQISPEIWGVLQHNLGMAYLYRIRGDKAENLEIAIAAYTKALEVRTRSDFPLDWAMTQNNLGNAYSQRIRGDKAENLETAITAYTAALEVRTRSDFPFDWADTQTNLGTAYLYRIRGGKAENIEFAITAYAEVLKVYTRSNFLVDWATTQNNLGEAYRNRIRGDKAENIESAIADSIFSALSPLILWE